MGHRDYKTTLIYADYAPIAHERELVENAFGASGAVEAVSAGPTGVGVERAEQLCRKPLRGQRRLDPRRKQRPGRLEVALADVCDEDGEQGARVCQQQALASIKPQQIRVPVVVAGRVIDEDKVAPAEQVE